MKLDEAYNILNLTPGTKSEDVKKQYRKLTKEFHPDINKEPGAEDKFKKINEAYQVVSSGKSTDRDEFSGWGGRSANPFYREHFVQLENIQISTIISFKESVLGCKKELKFNRKIKCKDCNGNGEIRHKNNCDKCSGNGQIINRHGNMVTVSTCDKCYGKMKISPCTQCNAEGSLNADTVITVTIPGGVQTDNVLCISGMGNYAGSFGPIEQHTDVLLHLQVTPEPELSLVDKDVVSTLEVSLIEALQGCNKSVKTILGNKDIEIKSKSRNKDEVIIQYLGVNRKGNHRIILDVKYPDDIKDLIEVLSERKS